MIALLRSTDGNPDSRFEKYVNFLESESVPYIIMCWDRFNKKTTLSNKLYYKKMSKYGQRFKNVTNLIGFNWFLLKNLIKQKKDYKIIHAADFDTIIPAIIMKIFFRKKVIYDIYDWYIDSRGLFKSFLKIPIYIMEFINIKLSDMVIICEPEREKQIKFKSKNLQILPNIPFFNEQRNYFPITLNPIKIVYVGILGGGRGLKNLITLAEKNPNIQINVGGFGDMERQFIEASDKLSNLNFYGKMPYKDAVEMMCKSELIYSMYERSNPNHILAAPNKYYEGLYLGKPIITTIGTLVGDKTEKFDTGYCIDESFESLQALIQNIKIEDIKHKSKNASSLWENKYISYVNNFMEHVYLSFIIKSHE